MTGTRVTSTWLVLGVLTCILAGCGSQPKPSHEWPLRNVNAPQVAEAVTDAHLDYVAGGPLKAQRWRAQHVTIGPAFGLHTLTATPSLQQQLAAPANEYLVPVSVNGRGVREIFITASGQPVVVTEGTPYFRALQRALHSVLDPLRQRDRPNVQLDMVHGQGTWSAVIGRMPNGRLLVSFFWPGDVPTSGVQEYRLYTGAQAEQLLASVYPSK